MLLPVVATRLTDRTPLDPGDFVFLGLLLVGVGGAYELAARATDRRAYRVGLAIALTAALLQAWINLAVGIIGSEENPANWLYGGVLAVAIAGAVVARFQPVGMGRTMVAAAIAQAVVFVVALVAGLGFTGPITVFFAALWLIAASLFHRASRKQGANGPLPTHR
jgi:hypothetical protein